MSHTPLLIICDLATLGALSLLGAMIVAGILRRPDRLTLLSLSLGVGAGCFSWSMFLLSWAGVLLDARTILVLYGVLMVFAALLARRARHATLAVESPTDPPRGGIDRWLTRGLWILIILLILSAASLAVGVSYFGWDDITNWVLKGYGIALEGSVFAGRNWGAVGLSYPMNITLLISLFRIMDGNLLPGSKLLYPIFYATLLIACYRFLLVHHLKRWVASLSVLLLATTPIMFTHAYMGYTNLAFTFYLITGMIWCLNSLEAGGRKEGLLGGLLLAIALWTRPEGFVMCIAVLAAIVLGWMLGGRRSYRWLVALIPLSIVGGVWFAFLRLQATSYQSSYGLIGVALRGVLAGQIHWSALYTILRYIAGQILRFRDWGFLPLLMGTLAALRFKLTRLRHDPIYTTLALAVLAIGLALIGFQHIAAYARADPSFVYDWLSLEFTRVAMPAGVGLALLGPLSLRETIAGRSG
jgi:hypothetical protein